MKSERLLLSLEREFSLPNWLGVRRRFQVRAVLNTLIRLSCWSTVAWLVWNHALSHFLNTEGIGLAMSIGLGAFLHVTSVFLDDGEHS